MPQHQNEPDYYKMPAQVHAALLDYLLRRPMMEVEPAVAILRALEPLVPEMPAQTNDRLPEA